MKTVNKYSINSSGVTFLYIPDGGEIIMCGIEHLTGDSPFIWALVDPSASDTTRKVISLLIGEQTDENIVSYIHTYVDSFNVEHHIFEIN